MDGVARTSALDETRHELTGRARGSFGRIAPERIADHLLRVTDDADWAVRRAALDALARRYAFARRDGLRVVERPPGGTALGAYRTAAGTSQRRREARPYVTEIASIDPLRTSCGCADFVRSSLGLCKHGLVVLEMLETKGTLARRAKASTRTTPTDATLTWSPVHPLVGAADRLARLACRDAGIPGFRGGRPTQDVLSNPGRRLAFIAHLEDAIRRGMIDAEAAVGTLLAEERARAERRVEGRASVPSVMRSLGSLGRKLYPYQRDGVKRFFESGRMLLADDMGLGKTTQAIAVCHGLHRSRRVERGLLIVPAALKPQWKREWEATTDAPLTLVEGLASERRRIYAGAKRGFLLIGYEQLLRDFEHVTRFSPDVVVLDEAQRIKNWATKSATYVKSLDPPFRLVLTGTPMENRFDELASIMDFVDDVALEPKWRITPWHTVSGGDGDRGASGARHLDTLRARLEPAMTRRIRKEVLAQLPPRTDTRVSVEMTEPQRDRHDDLRRPIAELMQKASRRGLLQAEFLRLMQLLTTQRMICNGLAQIDFDDEWPHLATRTATAETLGRLFTPKLAVLRGLVEQVAIDQGRKIVVFSQWRKMLRLSEWAIRDVLAGAGMRALFFTGAESGAIRERAIIDFHDDPAATVLFLSDAGGVGLNLQRAATCCINLELPWNPAVLEQRIGRIYRLGQAHPIDVYNLVAEEGIEARIAQLVAQKKAVFSSLFDGTSDEVCFEGQGSFLEGVKKLVDAVELPPRSVDAELDAPAMSPVNGDSVAAKPPESRDRLRVERLADGGLRIEAPPDLAAPLADLLETLARSLRQPDLSPEA